MESGTDFFFPWIRKNQGPSGMPKKSGFEHLIYLPYFIVVIGYFQTTDLVPLIEVYIQEHQYFASVSVILVFHCGFYLLLCVYFPCPEWNQIRRAVIFIRAAVIIVMIYATLVVVNTRYISLVMVPIIMLVFIGALCRQVSLRGSLKQDDSGSSEAEIAGDGSAEKSDGNNCGSADKEEVMVAIALLPYCALIMGRFHFGNLVVSQFFLFLSSTVGVLTLMVAWLSCSHLAPALDVLRRASLVVVLLTGHTMAGELLGEDVVLVCTPEIVAALLWFTSHLQLGHGGTTVITVDKVTSPQSGVICLSVVMGIFSYLARSIDESEGEDLLVRYRTAVIACAVSVILLSLCAFALRQWPGETKARPSSELEGAIRLFNFWRNVMSIAAALLLIVWPLVDVQLGLQVQRLSADSMGKFLDV